LRLKKKSLHYLLKPYHAHQLVEAVNRAKIKRSVVNKGVTIEQVEALIQQSRKPKTIRISTRDGIEFLLVDTILFVEADGNYATIHLSTNEKRTVSNPLKFIEKQLIEITNTFHRTHQSFLVNSDFIRGFKPDGSILLRGYDAEIPVARSFKSPLHL
jgi:two-component system, LytTR family, response regulator